MNIDRAQIVPVTAENTSEGTIRPARIPPSSGGGPTVEGSGAQNQVSPGSVPEEVVQVHSDTSTGSQILVFDFVDSKSGSLIFQIPSEQMLNLVQDIRQRLQRMADKQTGLGEVKSAD